MASSTQVTVHAAAVAAGIRPAEYLALTGTGESPGMFDVLTVLGRDTTLQRLDAALVRLAETT